MSYGDLEIKSSSKFLKIESGAPAHDIRILDESPEEKVIHGFGKDAVVCEGEGCGECAIGDEAKQRFIANVYDHTAKRQMTWEFGPAVAKQLKTIATAMGEDGKKISETDLRVEAQGQNLQKKYMVTPRMSAKPLPEGILAF